MKIAALYDIHGNLPALEMVLQELEGIQPDMIVVGGDTVSGPMPKQTLEYLRQAGENVVYIRGNADREVVTAFDGQSSALEMPENVREITQWTAYDLEAAAKHIRASGYPLAQNFADENVLKVPTAEEAIEIFERRLHSS